MAAISDLEALFGPYRIPDALAKLAKFEEEIGRIWYSRGFEISPNSRRSGVNSWSTAREFLNALFPFALANGSGSMYALWNEGKSDDPNEWPIVAFGDEGGVWIVAKNLLGLFALLTRDADPMIDYEGVDYYRSAKDQEFSEGRTQFLDWLRGTFQITPIEDAAPLISAAQFALQDRFDRWMSGYVAS